MTITDDKRQLLLTDVAGRIAEIQQLYFDMRKVMQAWMTACDDPTPDMPKKMLAKLSDIQAAHMLLLKAEDKFNDLSNDGGSDDPTADIDAIRTEIGGKLDRLRVAITQSGIPVEPE